MMTSTMDVFFNADTLFWCLFVLVLYYYLIGLIEEGLHPLRQSSDQPKRISKYIQAQHQHIHLFNSLKYTQMDTAKLTCIQRLV